MTSAHSRLLKRSLALAILVVIAAVAWLGVARPLASLVEDSDADLDRSLKLLAAYHRTAMTQPALEAGLKNLRTQDAALIGLIDGSTTEVAAAKLQGEIRRIIASNNGEIRTEQNLPATKVGDFERLEIRYEFATPMNSLRDVVHQIEFYVPYLFIDALQISAPENVRPDSSVDANLKLTVRWGIHAYRRLGGGA